MTNEQFERQIEFILKQQADFWAGLTRLERETERSRADIELLTTKMDALTTKVDALTTKVDALTIKVDTVTDLVGRTAQAVTTLVQRLDRYLDVK
jgi:outer membrane murein-binding lipoprotein Lpp